MKTEEQIFYKKVYIHSEKDLPKEAGFYFVNWTPGHAHHTTMGVVYYDESIKGLWFGKGWHDWYLLPVTLPSDEEIEEEFPTVIDKIIEVYKINPELISDETVKAIKEVQLSNECRQQGITWFKSRLTDK